MDEIRKLIADLSSKGPLLLVFHGAATELEYFTQEMQDTRSWMTSCPTSIHKPLQSKGKKDHTSFPVIIQDTQRLFAAYRGDPQYAQVNLKRACEEACLPVPIKHMYNAGTLSFVGHRTKLRVYFRQRCLLPAHAVRPAHGLAASTQHIPLASETFHVLPCLLPSKRFSRPFTDVYTPRFIHHVSSSIDDCPQSAPTSVSPHIDSSALPSTL